MVGRCICIKEANMKFNTGKVAFPIEFDNGESTVIYFNPTDADLAVRMSKLGEKLEQRIEQLLNNTEMNNDGTSKSGIDEDIAFVEKAQAEILDAIDEAFNSKIAREVFKYCSPLAIVDGNYSVINFIEGIAPEIEQKIQGMSIHFDDKMNDRLKKYGK